jgi:hypothetical protein
MLGPGMRQVRAVLPTDPAFMVDETSTVPGQPAPGSGSTDPQVGAITSDDQDVGSVDSAREMRQA